MGGLLGTVGIRDILDVLLVAALIYQGYLLVNGTRAVNVVRGVLIFAAIWLLSSLADLSALSYLLGRAGTVGLFALVVVFQPELRGALERLGRPRSRDAGRGGASVGRSDPTSVTERRTSETLAVASSAAEMRASTTSDIRTRRSGNIFTVSSCTMRSESDHA